MEQHTPVVYPPPPLSVSSADALVFENLADQLVAETLRTHDAFVSCNRFVDVTQWKIVRERHNMTAYRTRKHDSTRRFHRSRGSSDVTEAVVTSPQRPSFYSDIDDHTTNAVFSITDPSVNFYQAKEHEEEEEDEVFEPNVLEQAKPGRIPMVFCTGIVPGTVEDAALGFFADTEERSRCRNTSIKDVSVDDTRVLRLLQGPTEDDPFRFLGIKWCVHAPRGLIQTRDYVVLESTGLALDSKGQRFAYILNHSIEVDDVPEYRDLGIVRMVFSACHIIRPHCTMGSIEIFSRGFMDTRGYIAERLCTYIYCDKLTTIPQTVAEANTKKLAWLLSVQTRAREVKPFIVALNASDACPCCHQKLSKGLVKLLEGHCRCQLCGKSMCRKCSVKKALPIITGSLKQVTQMTMDFCLNCYLEALNLPAWRVAMNTTVVSPTANLCS